MSLEIAKGVGLTVLGAGLLATFATMVGMSNGHIFSNINDGLMASDGIVRFQNALMLTSLVASGVVGVAGTVAGAYWTKESLKEYTINKALEEDPKGKALEDKIDKALAD